jgi:hypothetical protein
MLVKCTFTYINYSKYTPSYGWPSFHLAVIFLDPLDEEEKVVKGLIEGCNLALRGYTKGKSPILSFSHSCKTFYMYV